MAVTDPPRKIEQRLIDGRYKAILVTEVSEKTLVEAQLVTFLESATKSGVGVAAAHNPGGSLAVLALSTSTQVLLLHTMGEGTKVRECEGRKLLQERLLCNPTFSIYAFDVHYLAISLYLDLSCYLSQAVDLQSLVPSVASRDPMKVVKSALGQDATVFETNFLDVFKDDLWDIKRRDQLVQRAWLSQLIGNLNALEISLAGVPRVATNEWDDAVLDLFSRTLRDAARLENMKPTSVTHEVADAFTHKNGKLTVSANKYASKFRQDSNMIVSVKVAKDTRQQYTRTALTSSVAGKLTKLEVSGNFEGHVIQSITSHGKSGPSSAESAKSLNVLYTLQKKIPPPFQNPWIRKFWSKSCTSVENPPVSENEGWGNVVSDVYDPWSTSPQTVTPSAHTSLVQPDSESHILLSDVESSPAAKEFIPLPSPPVQFKGPLNDSQTRAVEEMLSHESDTDITMIQGPPGTGKTSVITAFVSSLLAGSGRVVWLMAQSNVAVKNIAEKLVSCGIFNWKLIISAEFYDGWHEHLYDRALTENLILSHALSIKELKGCRVILCTLSMLFNKRLSSIVKAFPLETIVIDEASQIGVGDYIPVLSKYGDSIRKICFIGDNKQLPPYGQESISTLQSVFEKPHLCKNVIFLDTQYRMPVPIGNFISHEIYNDTLSSNPKHPFQLKTSCQFFDIADGKEESEGTSWKNQKEVEAVVMIAKLLAMQGHQYRIITGYDAQRNLIEKSLKNEELAWEDKCFNVDSFQGNEDFHIIISVVRSNRPGFLNDLRRTNVMLSRCKEAMYICSSRNFLEKVAPKTLIGRMAQEWAGEGWVDYDDVVNGNFHY